MPRLDLIRDTEGLTLYVHIPCGGTVWWDERPMRAGGDGSIESHGCEICAGEARPGPGGRWSRVWVLHPGVDSATA